MIIIPPTTDTGQGLGPHGRTALAAAAASLHREPEHDDEHPAVTA